MYAAVPCLKPNAISTSACGAQSSSPRLCDVVARTKRRFSFSSPTPKGWCAGRSCGLQSEDLEANAVPPRRERAMNMCWCAPPIEAEHRDARGLPAAGSVDRSASLGLLLAGPMIPIVIRFPTLLVRMISSHILPLVPLPLPGRLDDRSPVPPSLASERIQRLPNHRPTHRRGMRLIDHVQ